MDGRNIEHAFDCLVNEISKIVEKESTSGEIKNIQESNSITLDTNEKKKIDKEKAKKNNNNCC